MMFAELNHGRWIVKCPECPSASERGGPGFTDGVSFVCVNCGAGGVPVWPEDRDRIEVAVQGRPQRNRNWEPGEPVDLLIAENIEHEVGI